MDAIQCHRGSKASAYSTTTSVSARTLMLSSAADNLYYASSGLSLSCSLLTLYLIATMKKWTGYLGVVASLSTAQAIYDLSFLLYELQEISTGAGEVQTFVSFFGGIASTLWTNVLSLLLCLIILRNKHVNVKKHYHKFFLGVVIPAGTISLMAVLTNDLHHVCEYNVVFWLAFSTRIASIIFNVICYGAIALKMRSYGRSDSTATSQTCAIRVLASRLKYFSLVQIATRSTEVIYELVYSSHGYTPPNDEWSNERWASYLAEAILCPAAGVGFLVIFVCMQPQAAERVKKMFMIGPLLCGGRREEVVAGDRDATWQANDAADKESGIDSNSPTSVGHPLSVAALGFSVDTPEKASFASCDGNDNGTDELLLDAEAEDTEAMKRMMELDDDELLEAVVRESTIDQIYRPSRLSSLPRTA